MPVLQISFVINSRLAFVLPFGYSVRKRQRISLSFSRDATITLGNIIWFSNEIRRNSPFTWIKEKSSNENPKVTIVMLRVIRPLSKQDDPLVYRNSIKSFLDTIFGIWSLRFLFDNLIDMYSQWTAIIIFYQPRMFNSIMSTSYVISISPFAFRQAVWPDGKLKLHFFLYAYNFHVPNFYFIYFTSSSVRDLIVPILHSTYIWHSFVLKFVPV